MVLTGSTATVIRSEKEGKKEPAFPAELSEKSDHTERKKSVPALYKHFFVILVLTYPVV
jgi:hypothetical protein